MMVLYWIKKSSIILSLNIILQFFLDLECGSGPKSKKSSSV